MSDVSSILTGRINIKRLTASVLDKVAVASGLTPSRNPISTAKILVEVIGCTVSGGATVNIAGSTTESLSFTQNGVQITTKDFTSLSGFVLSGISGGFIKAKAINNMGQNINREITVSNNVPVRFFVQNGRIKTFEPGEQQVALTKIMTEPTLDIQNLDMIYVLSGLYGITTAQIDFVEALYDFDGATHHMEAIIKQP